LYSTFCFISSNTLGDRTLTEYHSTGSLLDSDSNVVPGKLFALLGGLAGRLSRHLNDVMEPFFKTIFDGISWLFTKIWDGLNWVFEQIGKFFEWLFSTGHKNISEVLNAPDSAYQSRLINAEELDNGLLGEGKRLYASSIDVFLSIPNGESDFSRIFPDKEPTNLALNEIEFVSNGIEELTSIYGDTVQRTLEGESLSDFIKYITESESKYLAIVGHNQSGEFAFLDPPPISISKMAALCANLNKKCIFLSCSSVDYIKPGSENIGVNRKISYLEAKHILEHISKYLSNNKETSTIDLARGIKLIVDRTIFIENIKPTVKFLVVTSTGGSMLAGVSIVFEDSEVSQ